MLLSDNSVFKKLLDVQAQVPTLMRYECPISQNQVFDVDMFIFISFTLNCLLMQSFIQQLTQSFKNALKALNVMHIYEMLFFFYLLILIYIFSFNQFPLIYFFFNFYSYTIWSPPKP